MTLLLEYDTAIMSKEYNVPEAGSLLLVGELEEVGVVVGLDHAKGLAIEVLGAT